MTFKGLIRVVDSRDTTLGDCRSLPTRYTIRSQNDEIVRRGPRVTGLARLACRLTPMGAVERGQVGVPFDQDLYFGQVDCRWARGSSLAIDLRPAHDHDLIDAVGCGESSWPARGRPPGSGDRQVRPRRRSPDLAGDHDVGPARQGLGQGFEGLATHDDQGLAHGDGAETASYRRGCATAGRRSGRSRRSRRLRRSGRSIAFDRSSNGDGGGDVRVEAVVEQLEVLVLEGKEVLNRRVEPHRGQRVPARGRAVRRPGSRWLL